MPAHAGIHIHVSCSAVNAKSAGLDGSIRAKFWLSWVPEGEDPKLPANHRHVSVDVLGSRLTPDGEPGDDAISLTHKLSAAIQSHKEAPPHRAGYESDYQPKGKAGLRRNMDTMATHGYIELDRVEAIDCGCCEDKGKVRITFYGNVKKKRKKPGTAFLLPLKLRLGKKKLEAPDCPGLDEPKDPDQPGPLPKTVAPRTPKPLNPPPPPPTPPPPVAPPVTPPAKVPPVARPKRKPPYIERSDTWLGRLLGAGLLIMYQTGIFHLGFGSYDRDRAITWLYVPWRVIDADAHLQVLEIERCLRASGVVCAANGDAIAIVGEEASGLPVVEFKLTFAYAGRGFPWHLTMDLWQPQDEQPLGISEEAGWNQIQLAAQPTRAPGHPGSINTASADSHSAFSGVEFNTEGTAPTDRE